MDVWGYRCLEVEEMSEDEKPKRGFAKRHTDLDVYQTAFGNASTIFTVSKRFPKEETYALTDQIRRSARSVCANLAVAWKKRRYPASFVSRLTDADAECGETQVWLQFAVEHEYLTREEGGDLYRRCEEVSAMLATMIRDADSWCRIKK